MTWDELAPGYLATRPDLSPGTHRQLRNWWARLSTWAQQQGVELPERLERDHLERFHQAMLWTLNSRGQLFTPNTISQALQMVRAVLRWAARHNGWPRDPCQGWLQPRAIQPPKKRLTRDEAQRVLSAPRTDTPMGLRDRALLAAFYSLGLGRSTCEALDLSQLDLPGRALTVGYRSLPLGAVLEGALERYLELGRPLLMRDPQQPALFLTYYGTRLSIQGMRVGLQQAGLQAGLGYSLTARDLARSGAVHAEELTQRFLFPFFS